MIDENSTKAEVLEAVERNGWALEFASEELRGDRDVVLAAVKQDWRALNYLSDELRMEIVQCWAKCMEQEVKND